MNLFGLRCCLLILELLLKEVILISNTVLSFTYTTHVYFPFPFTVVLVLCCSSTRTLTWQKSAGRSVSSF